jgi:hypothetical protein
MLENIEQELREMRYFLTDRKMLAVNNSKPGGREETHQIVREKNGRKKVLDSYPTADLASKMYQTWRHDLRASAKKNDNYLLKLQVVRKFADNDNGNWDTELHTTVKSTHITPYSKSYSNRLKKLQG